MLNFDLFQQGLLNAENCEDYLNSFFTKENYKQYQIDDELDSDEKKSLKTLFTSKEEIHERVENVLEDDGFCLEAFYAYMSITDDLFLKYRFESYYKQAGNYADMSVHQQKIYIMILDYYAQFLTDIDNITGAIKVWNLRYKLKKDPDVIRELCELYNLLEDADGYYHIYLYNDLNLKQYLLLLATLLKHDDTNRAAEVCKEMLEKIEYSDYLDHLFDLDMNDPNQKYVYDTVEGIYQQLICVPELFAFINKVKEK